MSSFVIRFYLFPTFLQALSHSDSPLASSARISSTLCLECCVHRKYAVKYVTGGMSRFLSHMMTSLLLLILNSQLNAKIQRNTGANGKDGLKDRAERI